MVRMFALAGGLTNLRMYRSKRRPVSYTHLDVYKRQDYGYGTYLTYQYTVKFGNVSATAYCVQPSKPGPGTGTYTINKVGDVYKRQV